MAIYVAYYDASGTQSDDGALVVIGLVATEARWRRFEKLWNRTLGQYGVAAHHTKHYTVSRGEFAGWGANEVRRAAYYAGLLDALKRGVNKGFVTAIEPGTFRAVNQHVVAANGAYLLAANACRRQVEEWLRARHPGNDLAHVFEHGDAGQGFLPSLIELGGSRASYSIVPKVDSRGRRFRQFEGADLVAWEIRRAVTDIATGARRGVRQSLREIGRLLPVSGSYVTAASLLAICRKRPDLFPPRS